MKTLFVECISCSTRFEWDVSKPDQRCPRCQTMQGEDVGAILIELKRQKTPGFDPIYKLLDILNNKITELEVVIGGKSVFTSDAKQNRKIKSDAKISEAGEDNVPGADSN